MGAGVVLFSAASLLNGLAQSSGMLIAGRGVQGLGGALLAPAVAAAAGRAHRNEYRLRARHRPVARSTSCQDGGSTSDSVRTVTAVAW